MCLRTVNSGTKSSVNFLRISEMRCDAGVLHEPQVMNTRPSPPTKERKPQMMNTPFLSR